MAFFAYPLFLDTRLKKLLSSPVSASAAPPIVMPFSDESSRIDVHFLESNNGRLAYVDDTVYGQFGAAQVLISSPDGADEFAEGTGLSFFDVPTVYTDEKQAGGGGFNTIHRVTLKDAGAYAPVGGYFALGVSPDFDSELALQRTPAFDALDWEASEIESALNAIYGEVGTIKISKVSAWQFDVEYSGALSDTYVAELLLISQELIAPIGIQFDMLWDDTLRSDIEAAGPEGYEAVLTVKGFLTMSMEEHILVSVPVTIMATPDFTP